MTLEAIDRARAREHLGPMLLPADFASLSFSAQFLAVIDSERTARGLLPFTAATSTLDALANRGAVTDDLPPEPGHPYREVRNDFDDGFLNVLDLDFQWMYSDGPGSGTDACTVPHDPGCWADRNILLGRYVTGPGRSLMLGAAIDPNGDSHPEDRGGTSSAFVFAVGPIGDSTDASWTALSTSARHRHLQPLATAPEDRSLAGIPVPPHTVHANPDYAPACAPSGTDASYGCEKAILAAIDNARAAEGVSPMTLPSGFMNFTIPEQLFVVVNLERVDRHLPPLLGLDSAMNANAQKGADSANDPPDPSQTLYDDELWAGGAVSALDADYGWMYDDGRGSSNLDCPRTGGKGCWDHRNGILDNFGTVGTLVMGAAFNPTADSATNGDPGGTSFAVTLAVLNQPPSSYLFTWGQASRGY